MLQFHGNIARPLHEGLGGVGRRRGDGDRVACVAPGVRDIHRAPANSRRRETVLGVPVPDQARVGAGVGMGEGKRGTGFDGDIFVGEVVVAGAGAADGGAQRLHTGRNGKGQRIHGGEPVVHAVAGGKGSERMRHTRNLQRIIEPQAVVVTEQRHAAGVGGIGIARTVGPRVAVGVVAQSDATGEAGSGNRPRGPGAVRKPDFDGMPPPREIGDDRDREHRTLRPGQQQRVAHAQVGAVIEFRRKHVVCADAVELPRVHPGLVALPGIC